MELKAYARDVFLKILIFTFLLRPQCYKFGNFKWKTSRNAYESPFVKSMQLFPLFVHSGEKCTKDILACWLEGARFIVITTRCLHTTNSRWDTIGNLLCFMIGKKTYLHYCYITIIQVYWTRWTGINSWCSSVVLIDRIYRLSQNWM